MKLFAALATLVLIAPAAHAQPQPSPFFVAFQTFCADPGVTPQKVRKAVQVAGGKLAGAPGSTKVPQPMYAVGWNVTVQGHAFLVTAGGVRAPYGPRMVQDSIDCSIVGDDSDGAAIEELKRWVTVAPSPPGSPFYDFEWNGQKRVPAPPDDPSSRADSEAGKLWTLTINGGGKFASVMLSHFLKPVPKP